MSAAGFEFLTGIFESLAGKTKAGIDDMVSTTIDVIGIVIPVGKAATGKVQYQLNQHMGTVMWNVESIFDTFEALTPKKYVSGFANRVVEFIVNGAVSALEDLNGTFAY